MAVKDGAAVYEVLDGHGTIWRHEEEGNRIGNTEEGTHTGRAGEGSEGRSNARSDRDGAPRGRHRPQAPKAAALRLSGHPLCCAEVRCFRA